MNTTIINQLSQNHRGTGNQKSNSLPKNASARKWLLILPLFLMTLGWSNLSWGQSLLVDDFSGTVGTNLTANGWVAHSGSGTTPMTIASPGLSYTNYLSSGVGNATSASGNGEDVNKSFTSTSSGSVYYSFMINTAITTTTEGYSLHLNQNNTTFFGRFWLRLVSGNVNFGLSKSGEAATYVATNYATNTTYFVVIKYTFNSGSTNNDGVEMWVNPALGGSEPTADISIASTQTDATSLSAISIRQWNASTLARFDGIRVGTTWASVTPASSCVAPTTQASAINFTGITSSGMTANWTIGNGGNRVVIMNTTNTFTAPGDGTDPTANPAYGGSGQQVVYNGSGNSVAVTGLSASTTYWFRVYEYNCTGTGTKYITSTGTNNPNSQATSAACTSQTITFGSLTTKTYGDASFSLTGTASSGLSVTYVSSNTAVATVSGSTVTIVGPGTCNITASQAGNGTYCAATDVIQSFTVNPKALTVTGATTTNKVYTGTVAATVSGGTLVGIVGADVVTLTQSGTFAQANVGTGIAITSTCSLGGANAGKYTLTQPSLTARNITTAPLTVTANDVSKEFGLVLTGGSGSTAFTSSGLVNSETIGSVTISYGTGAAAGDAVGTYPSQVTPSAATGGTFTSSNYSITYTSGTITVIVAPVYCGGETFTSSALTGTYSTGSFTGDNSVLWSYVDSRDESTYGITGKGIMFEGATTAKITSGSVPGGISSFTCSLKKAFTGSGNRQVELFINGVSKGTSIAWDNTTVQTFTVNNINVSGNVVIEIRNITTKQVVIDDISWTCYASTDPEITLSSLPTFENVCINTTAGPESFTITGTNLTTANVTVAALSGFTYSTTSGGTYTSTLTLTPSGGNLSQQVFVKFSPTLVQSYDGNIVVSGGGATSKNCAASGSGVNYAPTITSPTSASVTTTTALLGGNITDLGCSNVTKRGIFWSTTSDFADGTGTEVSTTAGAPYSTGAFTVNVSGLSASTVYYFKAFTENSIGRVYTSQGTFSTACTAITSLPWNEGFESLASVGTNVFPPCWYKENGEWQSADASTNTYNDPRTGTKYITNTHSATNEYIWTPGFTLTAGISYDFSFWYVGDGNAGWTGEVFYNTNQQSTGATQLGSAFITSSTTSVDTYGEVVSTFTPSSTGTYYFAIRVNANLTPWYIGYDDFQLKSSVIEPEPTNHATAFTCGTTTASSIPLTWSDATGTTTPHGYLVKWSSIGYGSIIAPADGTPEANGADVINIAYGLETVDINGLLANTTYYFKIFSYTNSGSFIDYKTDGTVLSTSCSTIDGPCIEESFEGTFPPTDWTNSGTIEKTSGGCEGTKHIAFNGSGDFIVSPSFNNPQTLTFDYKRSTNSDAWELKVQIGSSSTGPWTDIETINTLTTTCTSANINLSSYNSQSGLYLKFIDTRASGTAERYLDNIVVQCQSTPSIAISGSDPSNDDFIAGSINNTIYRISATTGGGQSQNITQVSFRIDALVTSMNALVSNYKLYYSTNNLLDAGDILIESEALISATDFQNVVFTGFTQTIHAGTTGYFFITTDILTNAVIGEEIQVSTPGVVFTTTGSATSSENYATANTHEILDSPSDVIAVIGSESNIVSSVINTAGPLTNAQGTKVWEFTVRDGGAAGDVDSKSTIVTGLTLTQNSGNSVNDWADAIESCDLFDANGNHLDQATLSATQIVFRICQ